jgi:hypothetical protein
VFSFIRLLLLPALLVLPLTTGASQSPPQRPLLLVPTAGYLSFGDYFTGPGGVRFSNQNGVGYGAQLSLRLRKNLSLVGTVLHGTSDWSFDEVPLLGNVTVDGASLWFYDAGLRLHFPLGSSPVSAFGQASAGAIRYAINNPLLTGHATNFTWSAAVGLMTQLGDRLSLQGQLKDYVASFRSVDEASAFGVEGRRAHTLAALIGVGVGF